MNILFLSRWFPFPPANGSQLRIYNLLKVLCEHHNVTFVSFRDGSDDVAKPVDDGHITVDEIHTLPWREYRPLSWRAMLGLISTRPRSIVDTYAKPMERMIRQVMRMKRFDLVIASQITMASYDHCFCGIPAIFEEAESGVYCQNRRTAGTAVMRGRFALTLFKYRHYMSKLLKSFAVCTVVSEAERLLLSDLVPGYRSIQVIPNFVDLREYEGITVAREPEMLVFTGALTFAPNYDGLEWFLNEVFPLVRRAIPNVRMVVVGHCPPGGFARAPGVVVAGYCDDVRQRVAIATVSVAPIRAGGGTRVKIIEAMALRTPVVATHKAAEGLNVVNGEHLLLADSAEEFANAVVSVLRFSELRKHLSERAYELVRAEYSLAAVAPRFLNVVHNAV